MADAGRRGKKMRSFTVAALLGIFVGAAVLAVLSRLLPGRLSRIVRSAMGGGRGEES
ncbi:MAG: hypothetical protein ABSA21_11940 [Candidatus Limnocylindrales bacterium]|jgi:HAMP domain-containing protein